MPYPPTVLDKAARLEQNGTFRASWRERHLSGLAACSPIGPVRLPLSHTLEPPNLPSSPPPPKLEPSCPPATRFARL